MTTPKRGGVKSPIRTYYCQRLNDAGFHYSLHLKNGIKKPFEFSQRIFVYLID